MLLRALSNATGDKACPQKFLETIVRDVAVQNKLVAAQHVASYGLVTAKRLRCMLKHFCKAKGCKWLEDRSAKPRVRSGSCFSESVVLE